jgi:hypothetical protein
MTEAMANLGVVPVRAIGLLNHFHPSYGVEFLRLASSVYPGYRVSPWVTSTLWDAICG